MSGEERSRILDMVAAGTISPREADRLISEMEPKQGAIPCPYCAEQIPAASLRCPECRSMVDGQGVARGGIKTLWQFKRLSRLSQFLTGYLIIISGMVLLGSLPFSLRMPLAGIGLAAGILMARGNYLGWVLGLGWSAAQIIRIKVAGVMVNHMFFSFSFYALNFVGIILLILFLKSAAEWRNRR